MGKTHTWAVQNLPFFYGTLPFSAKVVGVCTITEEKSHAVAAEFGMQIATTDEDDLINSPDIDVIDICTPNIYHYETLRYNVRKIRLVFLLMFPRIRAH